MTVKALIIDLDALLIDPRGDLDEIPDKPIHGDSTFLGETKRLNKAFGKNIERTYPEFVNKNNSLREALVSACNANIALNVITFSPKNKTREFLQSLDVNDLFADDNIINIDSGKSRLSSKIYEDIIEEYMPDLVANEVVLLDGVNMNRFAARSAGLNAPAVNDKYPITCILEDLAKQQSEQTIDDGCDL